MGRAFFERDTRSVARELLGSVLVRVFDGEELSGKIVEVEAYRGSNDPASHAFSGMTRRNAVMFGEPGHAYVYFTMGMHHCLNISTEKKGQPGAALVRALEPIQGIARMKVNRGVDSVTELANGPGKLTKAMRIDLSLNGEDMVTSGRLYIRNDDKGDIRVGRSSRIGIGAGVEFRWRYFVRDSPFVSKARTSRISTDLQNA